MVLNPIRLWRRRERLRREAVEEAQMLRRRHGEGAPAAAKTKLARTDLTTWHRQVVERAARLLETGDA